MEKRTFERDARILSTITCDTLRKALEDEENGRPLTDAAVRLLRQHIQATAARVTGSSLWLTINPCDLHDPIAQVFAGEHIDLDNFNAQLGPSKERQAQNVAADPYASAKFFHYLIKVILETLFGISYPLRHNAPSEGVFGRLTAYFGVVESQGRGTLHLHVLLWLANAPPMEEMEQQLKKPEFRNHVRNFIEANIHAYVPGDHPAQTVKVTMTNCFTWNNA